jgi:hypothetical protein
MLLTRLTHAASTHALAPAAQVAEVIQVAQANQVAPAMPATRKMLPAQPMRTLFQTARCAHGSTHAR